MVVARAYLTSFLVRTLYKITKDAKGTDPKIHVQYARRLHYRHTCQDVTRASSVFQDGSNVTTMFLFISFFRVSSSISTKIRQLSTQICTYYAQIFLCRNLSLGQDLIMYTQSQTMHAHL